MQTFLFCFSVKGKHLKFQLREREERKSKLFKHPQTILLPNKKRKKNGDKYQRKKKHAYWKFTNVQKQEATNM